MFWRVPQGSAPSWRAPASRSIPPAQGMAAAASPPGTERPAGVALGPPAAGAGAGARSGSAPHRPCCARRTRRAPERSSFAGRPDRSRRCRSGSAAARPCCRTTAPRRTPWCCSARCVGPRRGRGHRGPLLPGTPCQAKSCISGIRVWFWLPGSLVWVGEGLGRLHTAVKSIKRISP